MFTGLGGRAEPGRRAAQKVKDWDGL